jgi:hypothetical protein
VVTARLLVQVCTLMGVAWMGSALAQPIITVERPSFGVRFDVPADWQAEVTDTQENAETLTFSAPGGAGVVVVVLGRLSADDVAELAGAGPEVVWDAWEGFASEMQGVRAEREGVRTVAGIEAGVIDYVGEGVTGSLIGAVDAGRGVTIVSLAVDGFGDEVRRGLETILGSFAFLSAGVPGAPGAGNPLASPAQEPAARNPLAPPPADPPAATSVGEAGYHEPFTDTDPRSVFGGVLDVGSDGTWTGTLTGAAYRLANDAAPGAVRYYYLMDLPGEVGPLSQGTIGVTLGLAPGGDGLSAAGLLFDFDPSDGTYLAFALTTTGYVVLQRSDAGLDVLVTEDLDAVARDGRNRLELRSVGTAVEVIVNGETAATLNGGRPFAGGVGVVAVGVGAFEFQDFHYRGRDGLRAGRRRIVP